MPWSHVHVHVHAHVHVPHAHAARYEGAPAQQLCDYLSTAAIPDAHKQTLCSDFCASEPCDLPTFSLALARFANDLSHYRAVAAFANSF